MSSLHKNAKCVNGLLSAATGARFKGAGRQENSE